MSRRLICLALSAAFGTACVPAHALDLLQAVQAAAAIDPVVASVRAQADAVRERVPQALAGLRPTLNATAGGSFGYIDTNVAQPRTFDAQSIGLLATVPVYRPANREAWLQSQSNVEIAELQVEQARQDLILRVATAYFDVLSAQDSLAVVNAQARAFTEQYESARRNFEVGTATITDQQEAQSRLDLTRAQEASIRNDLDVKRALLAQLIGRPVDELHTLRQDLSVTTSDLAKEGEWAAVARDKSYAVRQAELAAEVAKREIDRQRFGHYPTFDITSQVNTNRNANAQTSAALIGQRSQFANIGVQLALPLYAGGAIDARVREAIALEAKATSDLETARRASEQAARQTFLGVRSGIETVRALSAAERSSQLALESNQLGYQVGVRINIDVLNAAQQLFSTQRDLAKARYDVLLNSLRLRATAGHLSEPEVAQLNALLEAPRATPIGANPTSVTPAGAQGSSATPTVAPTVTPASGSAPAAAETPASRGGRATLPRAPK